MVVFIKTVPEACRMEWLHHHDKIIVQPVIAQFGLSFAAFEQPLDHD